MVWECSLSLSDMQDYISKVRDGTASSSRSRGSLGEDESIDTATGQVREAGEAEEDEGSSDESVWNIWLFFGTCCTCG